MIASASVAGGLTVAVVLASPRAEAPVALAAPVPPHSPAVPAFANAALETSRITDAIASAPLQAAASCLPLTARNAGGNYIVPGTRGAIVYRRIGGGSGAKAATSATGATNVTELSLDAYVQPGGGRGRESSCCTAAAGSTAAARRSPASSWSC